MKYPTDIVDDCGSWGRIYEGHNLTLDKIERDMRDNTHAPMDGSIQIDEVHFRWVPRLKWCADFGGCDQEGEWHSHWVSVKPSESVRFTTAYWLIRAPGGQEKP